MNVAVFPAVAAASGNTHPADCPCVPCMEALVARLSQPLVTPAPLTDRALAEGADSREGRS